MIRLYRFPFSTNVERVALALAYKGLSVESVAVDPEDRSAVRRASGQDLVPVIDDEGTVTFDSMEIVRYLEERYPEEPLYPSDPPTRAEMLVFIDWFDRVWKRLPNEIFQEMQKPEPDSGRVAGLGRAMTAHLDLFEDLLSGREHLFGEFSAADCAAFPFVKYALLWDDGDRYLFHRILRDHQRLGDHHARVEAWIRRVDRRPRA